MLWAVDLMEKGLNPARHIKAASSTCPGAMSPATPAPSDRPPGQARTAWKKWVGWCTATLSWTSA